MRVALIADTHGVMPEIPADVDAILHAGDIGPDRPCQFFQPNGPLERWLDAHGKPMAATWGNHDKVGATLRDWRHGLSTRIIADQTVFLDTVPVWFSPWSNRYGNFEWMDDEAGLAERYAKIPVDTEVLVSHGPPYGYGDKTGPMHSSISVGSKALLARIGQLPNLRLVVTGHIHEARGEYVMANGVSVMNVASSINRGVPYPKPVVVIDWPPSRRE